MQFCYFLPGCGDVTKISQLTAAGLGHVFNDASAATPATPFSARGVQGGPGGQNGVIVSLSAGAAKYVPAEQIWRKHFREGYWCGMRTDSPPTPADLERPERLEGVPVLCEDGQKWIAPIAREFTEIDGEILGVKRLPEQLELDDDGRWMPGQVKPAYQRLWDLVCEFTAVVDEADESKLVFSFPDLDELAELALATNYRIGRLEMAMLGMYSDDVRGRIVKAVLDLDGFEKLIDGMDKEAKKKSDDGGGSSGGQNPPNADSVPTTGQA